MKAGVIPVGAKHVSCCAEKSAYIMSDTPEMMMNSMMTMLPAVKVKARAPKAIKGASKTRYRNRMAEKDLEQKLYYQSERLTGRRRFI